MRVLLCGICLIALQATNAGAQILASAADNPVPARPAAVAGPSGAANTIPEVIRQPVTPPAQTKAASAPAAALTPPDIDLRFLRAIRLDRDELGLSR
jgi:hypothetical protein